MSERMSDERCGCFAHDGRLIFAAHNIDRSKCRIHSDEAIAVLRQRVKELEAERDALRGLMRESGSELKGVTVRCEQCEDRNLPCVYCRSIDVLLRRIEEATK